MRLASLSSSSEVTNGNRVSAAIRRSAGFLESIEVFVNVGVVQTWHGHFGRFHSLVTMS
ncbi:hypothetical protein [Desulfomonile tiedjei]|uniref:Uncharacterized protein n=1 Tax=Desulfomonile tiedjei (strain ATCC 49306 / DSM 6799 / DCB-1) TaxID=706587 RepID=I4C235_DESTA|nr:hypothetical protein [Desulfomonile tiedjei]AFM23626.1 hypothetical protein Desti_0907 [Desulfomonile tiedjei DSM 6799]